MKIFIRSVQKEFSSERQALTTYLASDPLLRRFFETFLFERNVPASDRRRSTGSEAKSRTQSKAIRKGARTFLSAIHFPTTNAGWKTRSPFRDPDNALKGILKDIEV